MSTVEVCLIRHAESVSNAGGIWQGHGDSHLSERGLQQVDALAGAVSDEHFDIAVSSDLRRAFDTSKSLGRAIEADEAWREIDVGQWEGLTMQQVFEKFPEQVLALKNQCLRNIVNLHDGRLKNHFIFEWVMQVVQLHMLFSL